MFNLMVDPSAHQLTERPWVTPTLSPVLVGNDTEGGLALLDPSHREASPGLGLCRFQTAQVPHPGVVPVRRTSSLLTAYDVCATLPLISRRRYTHREDLSQAAVLL